MKNSNQKSNQLQEFKRIFISYDYDLFKHIQGNRSINPLHKSRLKKSMLKSPLFTVIFVNEKYEIIDGHHRYEVSKELRLPIYYCINDGYGLDEVHILNSTVQTWKPNDFIDGYCDLAYPEYLKYRNFMRKYGIKTHEVAINLLNDGKSIRNTRESIKNGDYQITNLKKAEFIADALQDIKRYYKNIYRVSFIIAITELCKLDSFDIYEFAKKLKKNSLMLRDASNKEHYIDMITEIYNRSRREKINFKYELDLIAKLEKENNK